MKKEQDRNQDTLLDNFGITKNEHMQVKHTKSVHSIIN